MNKTLKNTFLFIFLCSSLTFGCKKTEKLVPVEIEKTTQISIDILKAYFADMVNIKPSDIQYNEKTEQFSIGDYDQIDRKGLTESYLRSKNISKK
ncbi:hypothetical protein [Pedobacter sp. FW305-3-2-15-E-R2A2]|uniref:hypothetical protein n=1 Tax=Pedobacter sp. FW305-3-2-15-E-R2A2 TaxID=3140251 RepID=UPI003140C166